MCLTRSSLSLLGAVVLLAPMLIAPPASQAAFGAPVVVGVAPASSGEVAVDADGDGVIVWESGVIGASVIRARTFSTEGVRGPVRTVTAAGAQGYTPDVAISPSGEATIVWNENPGSMIRARTMSAAGVLGPVHTLSAPEADGGSPVVSVDMEGDATVAWESSETSGAAQVLARRLSAAGSLGPVETMQSEWQVADVVVASAPDGHSILAWSSIRDCCPHSYDIHARTLSDAGTPGALLTLRAHENLEAGDAAVGIADNGRATIAWSSNEEVAGGGSQWLIQSRTVARNGSLGATRTLSSPSHLSLAPSVSVNADGDAVVVWVAVTLTREHLMARTIPFGGPVGPTRILSSADQVEWAPQVWTAPSGDATAVWASRIASTWRVKTRSISAGSVLGTTQRLANNAMLPQVAGAPTGEMVLVWDQTGTQQVRAAGTAGVGG